LRVCGPVAVIAEDTADPIAGWREAITDCMMLLLSCPPWWPWLRKPWLWLWKTGWAWILGCTRWGWGWEERADCTAVLMLGVIVDRILEMMSDSDRPEDLEGWGTLTGAKFTCCS